ncbi:hypothetical protein EDD15DRAFT_2451118 [Pisolithus albus]|nr:hypothetical protein EDD15DRAFT_2451118 [Pisolithus albus]
MSTINGTVCKLGAWTWKIFLLPTLELTPCLRAQPVRDNHSWIWMLLGWKLWEPRTASIQDVFGDSMFGMSAPPQKCFSRDNSTFPSTLHMPRSKTTSSLMLVYVIILGYPPNKYSITIKYFKSLRATTDPLLHSIYYSSTRHQSDACTNVTDMLTKNLLHGDKHMCKPGCNVHVR